MSEEGGRVKSDGLISEWVEWTLIGFKGENEFAFAELRKCQVRIVTVWTFALIMRGGGHEITRRAVALGTNGVGRT